MIDEETLSEIWRGKHLNEMQQNLHYLQVLTLFAMDDYPFVFKGGTCLWFFYGLPRFSEDLDFTPINLLDENEFPVKFTSDIHLKLEKLFGIENNVEYKGYFRRDKTYAFIVIARCPHFNPTARHDGYTRLEIHVSSKSDVFLEPTPGKMSFEAYGVPEKIVSCMDPSEIAAEKVQSIITRNKSRDVFDLYHVITKFSVPFDIYMVNAKMLVKNEKYSYDVFSKKIDEEAGGWEELENLVFLRKKQRIGFEMCKSAILKWAESSKKMTKEERSCSYWKHL